jgi:toxin ParE1/3/4
LAENPALGQSAEAIRVGYRKHLSGSHVIYYRQSGAGIAVVRILHQRMDVRTRL